MTTWEVHTDKDISFWHCGRPGYWEDNEVFCSKCQQKMIEG
jgi:hypothetical protein